MGPPLTPVLANLFMGHHENKCLELYRNSNVLSYPCYLDDTFCLFNSEKDATLFFNNNCIKTQHPHIHFTMECETDQSIALTHSSLWSLFTGKEHSNYLGFSPFTYKLGLAKTLIDRTFEIKNTWMGYHWHLLSFYRRIASMRTL